MQLFALEKYITPVNQNNDGGGGNGGGNGGLVQGTLWG